MNKTETAFINGVIAGLSILSLYQDYLGLYPCLFYTWLHWAPSSFTVPLATLLLVIVTVYTLVLSIIEDHRK